MKEQLIRKSLKARAITKDKAPQITLILKAYQGLAIAILLLALTQ